MITHRTTFLTRAAAAAAASIGSAMPGPPTRSSRSASTFPSPAPTPSAARIANGGVMAFDEANASHAVKGYTFEVVKLDDATATAGQYDPAQAATNARNMVSDKGLRRRPRSADVRRRQGDGADPEPGQPRHHHPLLDQPRHHRPQVRRPVSARRQGDLLPHGRHRRLPGPQHGQLHGRHAEGEVGLRARRHRRLRRGPRRRVPGPGREEGHQGPRPRPARPEGGRLRGDPDQDQGAEPATRCITAASARPA